MEFKKFIWTPCAQLYSSVETPQPLPLHLGSYARALLVSQDNDISLQPPDTRLANPDQDASPICVTGPGSGS
jgi:hypothetical protein